jgi:hypothetical protein
MNLSFALEGKPMICTRTVVVTVTVKSWLQKGDCVVTDMVKAAAVRTDDVGMVGGVL